MQVNPATEPASIAGEVGAEVVEGDLRYQFGSWQLGDADLGEQLNRYRDQRLMVVFVPLGEAEMEPVTFGVCGFAMNEVRECPRCKLTVEDATREVACLRQYDDVSGRESTRAAGYSGSPERS